VNGRRSDAPGAQLGPAAGTPALVEITLGLPRGRYVDIATFDLLRVSVGQAGEAPLIQVSA
jgi:hypothetical protein